MKKLIITLLLLFTFLLAGNAQVSSEDSNQKRKNHHGHNSHGKGDRQHKGIRLFHGHHHHGEHNLRSAHGHHVGSKRDKGSQDTK